VKLDHLFLAPKSCPSTMVPSASTEISAIASPPVEVLSDLLYRVEQIRRALVTEALVHHQLNLSQWSTLKALWRWGPCSMTELAQASAIDRTSLTRTVDGLIARGWVTRSTLPGDRRAVIVETSNSGVDLARQAARDVDAAERRMISTLSDDQQTRLASDLERLLNGVASAGRLDNPAHWSLAKNLKSRLLNG
jgi:DNA-binding MarR family transcriptional regulator